MEIDPRTLQKIRRKADCHLIPACFGVSNVTVKLDGDFDSKVGTTCDSALQDFFNLYFSNRLSGKISLRNGSKSLTGIIVPEKEKISFVIPKPRTGDFEEWTARALGLQDDGKVQLESFKSGTVDCANAFLSMVHSAFLVLFHQGNKDNFSSAFDHVRAFLAKAIDRKLTGSDYELIREMVAMQVACHRSKIEGNTIDVNGYRRVYDPSFDCGDGLLDDFPNKCVSAENGRWVVTLPYSASLRVTVKVLKDANRARKRCVIP